MLNLAGSCENLCRKLFPVKNWKKGKTLQWIEYYASAGTNQTNIITPPEKIKGKVNNSLYSLKYILSVPSSRFLRYGKRLTESPNCFKRKLITKMKSNGIKCGCILKGNSTKQHYEPCYANSRRIYTSAILKKCSGVRRRNSTQTLINGKNTEEMTIGELLHSRNSIDSLKQEPFPWSNHTQVPTFAFNNFGKNLVNTHHSFDNMSVISNIQSHKGPIKTNRTQSKSEISEKFGKVIGRYQSIAYTVASKEEVNVAEDSGCNNELHANENPAQVKVTRSKKKSTLDRKEVGDLDDYGKRIEKKRNHNKASYLKGSLDDSNQSPKKSIISEKPVNREQIPVDISNHSSEISNVISSIDRSSSYIYRDLYITNKIIERLNKDRKAIDEKPKDSSKGKFKAADIGSDEQFEKNVSSDTSRKVEIGQTEGKSDMTGDDTYQDYPSILIDGVASNLENSSDSSSLKPPVVNVREAHSKSSNDNLDLNSTVDVTTETCITSSKSGNQVKVKVQEVQKFKDKRLPITFTTDSLMQIQGSCEKLRAANEIIEVAKAKLVLGSTKADATIKESLDHSVKLAELLSFLKHKVLLETGKATKKIPIHFEANSNKNNLNTHSNKLDAETTQKIRVPKVKKSSKTSNFEKPQPPLKDSIKNITGEAVPNSSNELTEKTSKLGFSKNPDRSYKDKSKSNADDCKFVKLGSEELGRLLGFTRTFKIDACPRKNNKDDDIKAGKSINKSDVPENQNEKGKQNTNKKILEIKPVVKNTSNFKKTDKYPNDTSSHVKNQLYKDKKVPTRNLNERDISILKGLKEASKKKKKSSLNNEVGEATQGKSDISTSVKTPKNENIEQYDYYSLKNKGTPITYEVIKMQSSSDSNDKSNTGKSPESERKMPFSPSVTPAKSSGNEDFTNLPKQTSINENLKTASRDVSIHKGVPIQEKHISPVVHNRKTSIDFKVANENKEANKTPHTSPDIPLNVSVSTEQTGQTTRHEKPKTDSKPNQSPSTQKFNSWWAEERSQPVIKRNPELERLEKDKIQPSKTEAERKIEHAGPNITQKESSKAEERKFLTPSESYKVIGQPSGIPSKTENVGQNTIQEKSAKSEETKSSTSSESSKLSVNRTWTKNMSDVSIEKNQLPQSSSTPSNPQDLSKPSTVKFDPKTIQIPEYYMLELDKLTKEIYPSSDAQPVQQSLVKPDQLMEFPLLNDLKLTYEKPSEGIICLDCKKDLDLKQKLKNAPSVTTVLNATMQDSSKMALARWRKRMISQLGVKGFQDFYRDQIGKGNEFHEKVQRHFSGHLQDLTISSNPALRSISGLSQFISDVTVVESHVMHERLQYRGVIDCVAKYKGMPVVIEWKRSDKKRLFLESTFDAPLQLCAYIGAMNFDDNYPLQVEGGIVVIAYGDGSPADVFMVPVKDCDKYWKQWLARLKKYRTDGGELTLP